VAMKEADHVEDSAKIPRSAVFERDLPLTVNPGQGGRPVLREEAYMWRAPALDGVELFRGKYTRYQASRHFHEGPAIGIVAKGSMKSYARGAVHTLPTGTVFLINPGEVHAPGPALPDGWVLRAFYFSEDFYAQLSRSLGLADVRFSKLFVHHARFSQSFLALHRRLEQSGDRLESESAMLFILGDIAHHYSDIPPKVHPGRPENKKVQRAKDFLVGNIRRGIGLDELASVVDFSPHHLLRAFRSVVGLTPHEFLTQIRVERAKYLLGQGRSISDVAVDTGFVDQAHFTRRFKALMGVTPGRYLTRHRQRTSPSNSD
jgi:AraC-like DNA-binding protein